MPKVRDESCGLHPNSNVAFLSRLHRAVRTSPNSGLRVNGARHSLTAERRRSRRWIGLGILVRSRRKRSFSCFCWDLRVSEQRSLGYRVVVGLSPQSLVFHEASDSEPFILSSMHHIILSPSLPVSLSPSLPVSLSLSLCSGLFAAGLM